MLACDLTKRVVLGAVEITVTCPARDRYSWADMKAVARAATNAPVPPRTLDYWIECADLLEGKHTPRTMVYREAHVDSLLWFLAHKLTYGRNQARIMYEQSIK